MLHTETKMSAEYRALYDAYFNQSVSDRDLDLPAAVPVSNQTTTPAVTLEPLNLTAIMLETAPVIDIVHEPWQHPVCRPSNSCLGCPRSLPSDGMTVPWFCSVNLRSRPTRTVLQFSTIIIQMFPLIFF